MGTGTSAAGARGLGWERGRLRFWSVLGAFCCCGGNGPGGSRAVAPAVGVTCLCGLCFPDRQKDREDGDRGPAAPLAPQHREYGAMAWLPARRGPGPGCPGEGGDVFVLLRCQMNPPPHNPVPRSPPCPMAPCSVPILLLSL